MSDDPRKRRAWRTDVEWRELRGRMDATDSQGAYPISNQKTRYRYPILAAAAIGAITIALTRSTVPETRTVSTKAGERTVVRLDDSSEIVLGPASRIEYTIGKDRRDITLDGLAEFKVVHDGKRPFVVRARNAITTDLGTEFVIRAYASDTAVRVAVTTGTVSLRGVTASTGIKLRSGQVAQIAASGIVRPDSNTSAVSEAAWTDGRLRFTNASLEDVAVELSRWFDVDIRIPDDALARRRVSAVYTDATISGVLDALTVTVGARYERKGRLVIIQRRAP